MLKVNLSWIIYCSLRIIVKNRVLVNSNHVQYIFKNSNIIKYVYVFEKFLKYNYLMINLVILTKKLYTSRK